MGNALEIVGENIRGNGRGRAHIIFQRPHALLFDIPGQATADPGRSNPDHGRLFNQPLTQTEFEKRFECGDLPVNTFGGHGIFHELRQPASDHNMTEILNSCIAVAGGYIIKKLGKIVAIGSAGMR